jgi:hypothetical protein
MPRTPRITGGIVIGEPHAPSTVARNTCLLQPKEAGSFGTSNSRVKKEEADAPLPPRFRVKEEDDVSPPSLKKTCHLRC